MVVGVLPNIIKVVVLTPCTDTLLGIDHATEFSKIAVRINSSEKNWLELNQERKKGNS